MQEKVRCRSEQQYNGVIGGADSFTIIGKSGIGKSSAISRALRLIEAENRKHLYDKQAFESMCEYAGNNYYVLYDGMETILFKLEKLISFSLNEAQRNSLAQVGMESFFILN